MPKKLTTILSIAGSDPTGGAGIQSDIRAGNLLGVHVTTAITAITAQNSKGVQKIYAVSPDLLDTQLNSIKEEMLPDSIKIGMIGSPGNMKVIVSFLNQLPKEIPIVVDPVMKSTAGDTALTETVDESEIMNDLYKEILFPIATIITPNIEELNFFSKDSSLSWCKRLNCKAVIVKGNIIDQNYIEDRFESEDLSFSHRHSKVDSINLHGTGCAYSTLLASYLALGYSLSKAALGASSKIADIIQNSCDYQLGESNYGPLNINNYKL